jgi:predicted anti-sigma-YlaC factor YlaD
MTDHPGEALSAYLDDELDPAARAAVEAHLAVCGPCRAVVDDLQRLRADAASWATGTASPSADLWAGIAARLDPPVASSGARVLSWHQRRWSLGVVELAVAATLVAAVTAGLLWRGAPGAAPAPEAGPAPVLAQVEPVGVPDGAVTTVSFADAQFDAAVADLERVLRDQRDQLNPRTVQVLERNLQIIDDAIREARTALETDPANALLNAHLASARQRKLNLLRRAALISEGV